MSYAPSSNFAFLAEYDARLVAVSTSAERALSIDDAVGALMHLRVFAEHLAKNAAAELGVYDSREADQVDRLRALKSRGVDDQVMQMFHAIRRAGNRAAHDHLGTQGEAFQHLKMAYQLAVWFYRTVKHSPAFRAPAFVPPADLIGATRELQKELEDLRAENEAREEERDEAQEAVEQELNKRLGLEEAARRAQEERDTRAAGGRAPEPGRPGSRGVGRRGTGKQRGGGQEHRSG